LKIKSIGKAIGHTYAAILLLSGFALMLLGKSMWDTGWSGGGGVPPVFILMGAFAFFAGVTIAGYAAIGWTIGTLVQLLGWKKSLGLVAVALISGYTLSYFGVYGQLSSLFESDSASETVVTASQFPVPAAVLGPTKVSVQATASRNSEKTALLDGGDEVILLEVLETEINGHPWFRISYAGDSEGYLLGSSICATRKWVNGLKNVCVSDELSFEQDHLDADGLLLEKIELAHKILPGRWQGLPTIYPIVIFHTDGRISDGQNRKKMGRWSIEAVDESQSPTGLSIKHSVWSAKLSFTGGSVGYDSVLTPIAKLDPDQIEDRVPSTDGSQIRINGRALYPSDR
jgi:hypothetical protein